MSVLGPLGRIVRAGVGRRRVQSVVMALTTMMAVTASIMAAALVVASQEPFDHAFAQQHGAHLTARFDGTKASAGQLAATAHTAGVTTAAGPYAVVSAAPQLAPPDGPPFLAPAFTIAGRGRADGPLDALTLTAGRWVTGPGQIVLADGWGPPQVVGTRITFPALPGHPALTVVGTARSVTKTADAWVDPAQIAALTAPGATPDYQMLYRFSHAGSTAQINADRAALTAAAPAGSLTGAASYLIAKETANQQTATFVPFVVAFGVLGLIMSVLIVGIVVSGAVSAGTRRIGILKSLGFTPAQVGRAYVGQALIPASAGVALGLLVGNLGSVPLLSQAEGAYGTGSLTVAGWIDVAVPGGVLLLVVVSALAPALRAGRLRTVEAIAIGRTPRVGRGRLAARLAGRLPLPRALSLGLAGPFARPGRSATISAAIVFGAVGVTFAYGLGASLNAIQRGINRDQPGQVTVTAYARPGPFVAGQAPPRPVPVDPAAVARAIAEQPGTRAYFADEFTEVGFAGVSGTTMAVSYQGDSSWGAYQMVSGHWFTGPGQIVVARRFLEATDKRVGDTVTLEGNGRGTPVRIVGEAFTTGSDGMRVLTDNATLARVGLDDRPRDFQIDLKPGTDRAAYLTALNTALRPTGVEANAGIGNTSGTIIAMDSIIATLTLMLVLVAGLGVLNTVVLDTRERVHDLGVLKALGMAPRQTVAMVITSVAGIGLVAGVLGVPLGVALQRYVVPLMGHAAGTTIPVVDLDVYHLPQLLLLGAGGLAIATAGAVLPAGWAARTGTARALRTE
jgi:putative ABC transport system permease protein